MSLHLKPYSASNERTGRFAGMRLVGGGTFWMGSEGFYEDERPVRPASVGDFWMDETPVTNRQFAAFVRPKPAIVTVAEHRPIDPALYPDRRSGVG